MAALPVHQVGVASCMARTAEDTGSETWLDKSADDDIRVHRHRFGEGAVRGPELGLQDRTGDNRSLGRPVWEVQEDTGQ